MAGIKFHAAIDVGDRGNHIFRTVRGLWLDWMAQGTRVSGNLFHDNAAEDLFVEVNHGPFMVDNNLFLSGTSLLDMSEGRRLRPQSVWLEGSSVGAEPNPIHAPYHPAHTTSVAGLRSIRGGDNRFYNNIFVGVAGAALEPPSATDWAHRTSGYGLQAYNQRSGPLQTGGNVYLSGARPSPARPEPSCGRRRVPRRAGGRRRRVLPPSRGGRRARRRRHPPRDHPPPRQAPRRTGAVRKRRRFARHRGPRLLRQASRSGTRPTPGPFERPGSGELEAAGCAEPGGSPPTVPG